MSNDSYKSKYLEMRNKLLESVDVAFRDGYSQGLEKGEMQAQQQQQMEQEQAMMEEQAAMEGGAPGAPSGEEAAAMGEQAEGMMGEEMGEEGMEEGGGSELDQSIGELEGLVQKGEKPKVTDLRKAIDKVVGIRKSQLTKSQQKQKKINSAQNQFVSNILKSWDSKTKDVTEDLEEAIKENGFKVE